MHYSTSSSFYSATFNPEDSCRFTCVCAYFTRAPECASAWMLGAYIHSASKILLLDLLSIFRQVATEALHSRYHYEFLGKAIPLPYCARKEGLFVLLCPGEWDQISIWMCCPRWSCDGLDVVLHVQIYQRVVHIVQHGQPKNFSPLLK